MVPRREVRALHGYNCHRREKNSSRCADSSCARAYKCGELVVQEDGILLFGLWALWLPRCSETSACFSQRNHVELTFGSLRNYYIAARSSASLILNTTLTVPFPPVFLYFCGEGLTDISTVQMDSNFDTSAPEANLTQDLTVKAGWVGEWAPWAEHSELTDPPTHLQVRGGASHCC